MGICASKDIEKDHAAARKSGSISHHSTNSRSPTPADSFQDKEGRRFLAAFDPLAPGKEGDLIYTLPNDDEEMDRLHLQHYMLRYAFQANFLAPVRAMLETPGARILDVGCGSGIWAMEMATEFPKAEVLATDLAPVQPSEIKPRNLTFGVDDITQPLPYETGSFDFVRMRYLILGLKVDQWQGVVNELARIVKPGGYLELMEPDFKVETTCEAIIELNPVVTGFVRARGGDPSIGPKIYQFLANCPELRNPKELFVILPMRSNTNNPRLDRLGRLWREDMIAGSMALKPGVVGYKFKSSEDYDALVEKMREQLPTANGGSKVFVSYAQKV